MIAIAEAIQNAFNAGNDVSAPTQKAKISVSEVAVIDTPAYFNVAPTFFTKLLFSLSASVILL